MTIKKFLEVQFHNWEKPRLVDPKDQEVKPGDWILISLEDGQQEIGKVVDMGEMKEEGEQPMVSLLRVAELDDLNKVKQQQENRGEALKVCRQLINKYKLPMKLVDCCFSFDDKKITFAFTSDSRVDFRELVKELTRYFKRGIRLQQIGIRDEFKQLGGIGPCGRSLCCHGFLKDLGNITTDLARLQHIEHRGSERLSGACGRLKCCLNYESEGYREMSEKMPPIGSPYKTKDQGRGEVIGWHILRHSVDVRVAEGNIVEEFLGCRRVNCSGCQAKCKNQQKNK